MYYHQFTPPYFLGTGKGKRKKGGKETPSGEKGDETESQKDDKPPTPEAAEPKGDEEGEGEGEGEGETEKAPKTVRIYYTPTRTSIKRISKYLWLAMFQIHVR